MSLISKNVLDEFAVWAERNEDKKIFPEICRGEKSYYIDRDEETPYMMEYAFKTLAEIKGALEMYSGLSFDAQILKLVTVEICQDRYKSELDIQPEKKMADNKASELPEFIYVF